MKKEIKKLLFWFAPNTLICAMVIIYSTFNLFNIEFLDLTKEQCNSIILFGTIIYYIFISRSIDILYDAIDITKN